MFPRCIRLLACAESQARGGSSAVGVSPYSRWPPSSSWQQRVPRHGVPLTVRGAGTGNYGQCVPLDGGVVMLTTGLQRIRRS